MGVLITTAVALDTDKQARQPVIHLKQGDAGTRRLRLVPSCGGHGVRVENAAAAQVRARSQTGEMLLLDCERSDAYAHFTPTPALTAQAGEYECELVLLDGAGNTLTSANFTILVHASAYTGDAVEHTNSAIGEAYYDEEGRLCLRMLDGREVRAERWTHTHENATKETPGFMSGEDQAAMEEMRGRVDQDVRRAASPTFAALHIGAVTIDGESGLASGLRFS